VGCRADLTGGVRRAAMEAVSSNARPDLRHHLAIKRSMFRDGSA
jgi:hypothetical protein